MQSIFHGRVSTMTLAVLYLVAQLTMAMPSNSWAQNLDTDPPVIDFNPVDKGIVGESQVFTAAVTDDNGVRSVVLHYRLDGESLYQDRKMELLGNSGIYTTTVATEENVKTIQYYIEATDLAGNRTLQGFAFDPVERQLAPRPAPIIATPVAEADTGMSTREKVLYGVLGLVIVGALASAAGGGGGGGSEPQVDVTIISDPLP
jgi:hypothetical protein